MSNLTAAVGCGAISATDNVVRKRRSNVELYNKLLGYDWYASSPHCYPYHYPTEDLRDTTLLRLEKNGVEARKLFSCIPTVEYKLEGHYPRAEEFSETGLFLPIHQDLTNEDIAKVVALL